MLINADAIRRLRQQRGWTQQHLADACEINLRTVQRIEKNGRIAADTLQALCVVLETSPEGLSPVPDFSSGEFHKVNPLRHYGLTIVAAFAGFFAGILTMLFFI